MYRLYSASKPTMAKTHTLRFTRIFLVEVSACGEIMQTFPYANRQPLLMMYCSNNGHPRQMLHRTAHVRVFIADDSPLISERIAVMLEACAMIIVGQAKTPKESIDGILASCPDVVVLDIQLGGGSGLQVLRAVRHKVPHIAFVMFSNSSGPSYRKCFLGEGAEDFLDKSHEFDQLAHAVAKASRHVAH